MQRASLEEEERPDATLYVDETHNYLALPRSFEDLLAEARGYRLSLVLAHQHMGQLTKDVRDALAANARTKVVFTCSPEDALILERHFAPDLSAYDLSHLATFQSACRPCVRGGQGQAFTFRTEALPDGSKGRAEAVRRRSAELFAVPRGDVEDDHRQPPDGRGNRAAAARTASAIPRAVRRTIPRAFPERSSPLDATPRESAGERP